MHVYSICSIVGNADLALSEDVKMNKWSAVGNVQCRGVGMMAAIPDFLFVDLLMTSATLPLISAVVRLNDSK